MSDNTSEGTTSTVMSGSKSKQKNKQNKNKQGKSKQTDSSVPMTIPEVVIPKVTVPEVVQSTIKQDDATITDEMIAKALNFNEWSAGYGHEVSYAIISDYDKMRKEVAVKEAEIASLNTTIGERNDAISVLTSKLEESTCSIMAYENKLVEKEAEISALYDEIAALKDEITYLNSVKKEMNDAYIRVEEERDECRDNNRKNNEAWQRRYEKLEIDYKRAIGIRNGKTETASDNTDDSSLQISNDTSVTVTPSDAILNKNE